MFKPVTKKGRALAENYKFLKLISLFRNSACVKVAIKMSESEEAYSAL
eukprot:CAMPEP_0170546086 /NCGR_PEP_ID=MMETSP0211-20121228/4452_1 /TAXON_ID=311385 /ORGANISM="Pseudokeronopsis sp., Strain OXSARD2" /LENGTH=47 /DNA_ID= /DNA_START= /DNA_END= /DNA_ORIENTATION=